MSNLNVLRLMGSVVDASAADPARLMLRGSAGRAFRGGFSQLLGDMKGLEVARSEVTYAGAGLDIMNHARLSAMTDVFDQFTPGTRPERALQYLTNNMGKIAAFDYWNSTLKQTSGVMHTMRLVHDVQQIIQQGPGTTRAHRYLARALIDDDMADRIWKQMTEVPGGSNEYNGALVPNTEAWVDREAARAFQSSVVRSVDDTIVTPGVERPLWVDGSMFGRLVAQFRSFNLASLTKTLLYSGQELKHGNLNILPGIAFSLALGMGSWYLRAKFVGGSLEEKMQEASFEQWIDEGVNRSGLLGPVQELLTLGSKIPGLSQYTTLSGEGITRTYSPYSDPFIDAFGPTVGLLKSLQTLAVTASEPKEATVRAAQRLLPYHTLFYARRALGDVSESIADGL